MVRRGKEEWCNIVLNREREKRDERELWNMEKGRRGECNRNGGKVKEQKIKYHKSETNLEK